MNTKTKSETIKNESEIQQKQVKHKTPNFPVICRLHSIFLKPYQNFAVIRLSMFKSPYDQYFWHHIKK